MTTGYCVKCKQQQKMSNVRVRKIRAWMAFGNCSKCGTKMSRTLRAGNLEIPV